MEASSSNIEIKLSNTDTKSTNSKISQTKNPGSISHNNCINLITLPVVNHAGHLPLVILAEVHASGSSVQVREVGASPAHCGRVDDGSHLIEVIHQQSVEQCLIPVLQRLQHLPLPDVVRLDSTLDDLIIRLLLSSGSPALPVLRHDHLALLHLVQCGGWHQSSDTQSVSLCPGEAKTLVKERITEQILASLPHNLRLQILSPAHLGCDASLLFNTSNSCTE